MIDAEVERVCKELTEQKNPSGVEAVLKVALYYTEKLALSNPSKTIVVEKKIETRHDESKPKQSHASDEVDEFSDAMSEAEKNLGLPPA